MKKFFLAVYFLGSVLQLGADNKSSKARGFGIDTDPNVVYVSEILQNQQVELGISEPTHVYATRSGGRKLGALKGGKVRLIGFDDRAAKIQGQGKIGWVKISSLVAEKGNIQELLKTVYSREIEVKELIAHGEIALGMTREEITRVVGKPTKQTLRRTKEGVSGTLEFIEYEEIEHFSPVIDPFTGNLFQRFTHTTEEEKSKLVVELEDGIATAIEESETENGGDVRVVIRPALWIW